MERIIQKCFKLVLVYTVSITIPLKDIRPARFYLLINECRKSKCIVFPVSATKRFTSAVDWGEFSVSSPATGFHCVGGWVSHKSSLEAMKMAEIPSSFRELNSDSSLVQTVLQSLHWLHHWWFCVRPKKASYLLGHDSFLRKTKNKYTFLYIYRVLRKRRERMKGNKWVEIPKNISRILCGVLTSLPTKSWYFFTYTFPII